MEFRGLDFRSDVESRLSLLSVEPVLLVKVSVMLTVWLLITIFLHNDALTIYMDSLPTRLPTLPPHLPPVILPACRSTPMKNRDLCISSAFSKAVRTDRQSRLTCSTCHPKAKLVISVTQSGIASRQMIHIITEQPVIVCFVFWTVHFQ